MSVNEALHSYCPSLSVKIALGIGLFNNALLAMGTERHSKYYNAAWNREVAQYCVPLTIFVKLQFIEFISSLHVWQ